MKKRLILFCCLGVFQQAFTQTDFVANKAQLITTLSFEEMTGGIIIIKAKLNENSDSLNFILDTGSGGASIDSALAVLLGLKIVPSEKIVKGIAGIKKVPFTYNHQLLFPNLNIDHLDFYINDYSLLTSVYGVKIDGIIGYSFLRKFIFLINYDTHLISVYSPGEYDYKGGEFLKTKFYNLPVTTLVLKDANKQTPNFIFDIGAGLNVLISEKYDSTNTLFFKKRNRLPVQAEGIGGKKKMNISIVGKVQIGPFHFKNVPVHIFDDEYNVTNYPNIGGILGNDLLRRFNVVLNYPNESIYISPNKHFNDLFDYAYTGLGIYLVGNQITVVDIQQKSPGEKAGFQSGDIIMSVGNRIIYNIQELKNALQNSIGKVKVIVFRNGIPLPLTIRIRDIRRRF
jgi:hypothetical protein